MCVLNQLHTINQLQHTESTFVPAGSKKRLSEEQLDVSIQKKALVIINTQTEADRKIIEAALGFSEKSSAELFEKQYGISMQTIMDAMFQELDEVRKLSTEKVGFGGFKKAGIKKWKFVFKLDDHLNITDIFIGRYKSEGSYTKVYLTANNKAILVPKKVRKVQISKC